MTRRAFADELEKTANRIGDIGRTDLQILLRRAALRIRNSDGLLNADVDHAVDLLAVELQIPRRDILQTIVRDWLIRSGRLRADTLDEESETDGAA
jgi:hypothetical protein